MHRVAVLRADHQVQAFRRAKLTPRVVVAAVEGRALMVLMVERAQMALTVGLVVVGPKAVGMVVPLAAVAAHKAPVARSKVLSRAQVAVACIPGWERHAVALLLP